MKLIRIDDLDLQEIEGNRCRRFQTVTKSLSGTLILERIRTQNYKRVIVICNTVSQSQGLFRDLENLNQENEMKLTLLHSRFLPEDRKEKEASLEKIFGQDWRDNKDEKCHVLIATQVIEVGINITCEVMYTQLCPMSSLLQRAGRCARFCGEDGEVYIYRKIKINDSNTELVEADLDEDVNQESQAKRKFLPYEDEICERTWEVLQEHNSEVAVGFRTEEKWINQVHQKQSKLESSRRHNNRLEFDNKFNAAIFRGEISASRDLIRLIDNRNIFVTEEPTVIDSDAKEVDLDKLQAFSLPVTTLQKAWREFQGNQTWLFRRIENPSGKEAETYKQPICQEIKSLNELSSSIRILVNPNYAYYNDRIGFRISLNPELEDSHDKFISRRKSKKVSISQYSYRMDTYVGHLGRMWTCWHKPFKTQHNINETSQETVYKSVRDELLAAGGRFIKQKIFSQSTKAETEALFEFLVFLAILTHDLGKLQVKWQQVMRGWQQIAHEEFPEHKFTNPRAYLLAHTDYKPDIPEVKKRYDEYMKQNSRPPHAIESAFLACEILESHLFPILEDNFHADDEQIERIFQVIIMAAGRHHSAWTNGWKLSDLDKIGTINLHPKANEVIHESWRKLSRFLPETITLSSEPIFLGETTYSAEKFNLNFFQPDQLEYQQFYTLVVRALRLCDMRSVQLH